MAKGDLEMCGSEREKEEEKDNPTILSIYTVNDRLFIRWVDKNRGLNNSTLCVFASEAVALSLLFQSHWIIWEELLLRFN